MLQHSLDLFGRPEPLDLLLCFVKDSSKRHIRILLHEFILVVLLEQRDVLLRDASPSDLAFGIRLKANLHILVIVFFVNQHECSVADFFDCPEMVYPEGVCLFLVAALSNQLPNRFLRSLLELFLLGLG